MTVAKRFTPTKRDTSHVRFHPQTGSMFCAHCGDKHDLHLPQPIGAVSALSTWFTNEHAHCKPGKPVCELCLQIGHATDVCPKLSPKTPDEWYHGPDSGISSKVICGVATGAHYIPHPASTPQDPGDFGRCYRLLKLFPWMREKLASVAIMFPHWRTLVADWDGLTRLYEEELPSGRAPKLAKRLNKLNARRT